MCLKIVFAFISLKVKFMYFYISLNIIYTDNVTVYVVLKLCTLDWILCCSNTKVNYNNN